MSLRDKYDDEEWAELEKRSKAFFEDKKKEEQVRYKRVVILSDDSGHDYVVPFELKDEFLRLLDLGEVAEDEFEDKFEQYRCGGDPFGEYEFYIKA
jgi:hypothetical protein